MKSLDTELRKTAQWTGGGMINRLRAELLYARRVSLVNGGAYDGLIKDALMSANALVEDQGALTESDVLKIEETLMPMASACKKYRLLMVGHAHIDMNWMWRYDETVSITLDTFRTMLNLMDEFPDFTFSQSQASTYRIAELFEPEMIGEIIGRIKAGQWEVSASTWVEADRNMPGPESVARHFLYTKNYLPKLLGIDPKDLNLDYEPDTFGHHPNVPDMLANGGVKYYYHCRGDEGEILSKWRAPSGKEIIVYREPFWYLGAIDCAMAEFVPEFCEKYGMDTAMRVYGVGDHGGGPTRRDIERIIAMGKWPIYPAVEFGSYKQFYSAADAVKDRLPVTERERNFIFSGCYTSQSRIKAGNAISERLLFSAEALSAMASINAGMKYDRRAFENAWRNVLFNQFHDIIPGSGVADTREYAMGLYQETYAAAQTATRAATAKLAAKIDTSAFMAGTIEGGTAEGAGVGFGVEGHRLAQVERGGGSTSRIFHIFNPLPYPRKEIVEVVLWDFREDLDRIEIVDEKGEVFRHQLIDHKLNDYWQHQYTRILVEAELPALGYKTLGVRLMEDMPPKTLYGGDLRLEKPFVPVLENECIRAAFDPVTGALTSLIDKSCGKELLGKGGGRFMKIVESADAGMTSWIVGRPMKEEEIATTATFVYDLKGTLRNALRFESRFGASRLQYTVSLDAGSDALEYCATCDWLEPGSLSGIPQLQYRLGISEEKDDFLYAVPGGATRRPSMDMDVPALHVIAAEGSATIQSDTKYGFRGCEDRMSVTLIRSSIDPDPFPELGRHVFSLRIGVAHAADMEEMLVNAQLGATSPIVISGSNHEGNAPLSTSFLSLKGAVVNGIKLAEDEDSLILRGYEANGIGGEAVIELSRKPSACETVDSLERPVPGNAKIDGNHVIIPIGKHGAFTAKIYFGG